ncbi:helix-turn-helix domain-containing protein [Nocardiopsis alborubida]|uniref:helix-turn-helix domain-containing protein n=1 Tax=Nocardiopsis alborubida TaxID=146802 RepID=UPI001E51154C|nr:helix-turn-helix transcriptional regulator [Nocardiopsis alborubida]
MIRARREHRGWSLTDLANMVGIGQALIEQLEAGRPLPGRPDVVHAVLDVLDITAQVVWRQVLGAAGARTAQVDVGWVPMTVEMAVIADVATPERMEEACESVYGTSNRPPGLVVASHSNGPEGEGEERSLELAATMGAWFGPAYQVRNGAGFSLFWDPSLLTLQRWDIDLPAAKVRTAAGTTLTITPQARAVTHGQATLVCPTDPLPERAALRPLSTHLWATPDLHNAVIPDSTRQSGPITSTAFLLPLTRGNSFSSAN